MKLRNRKTGEIINLDIANIKAQFGVISVIPEPAVLSSPEYVYASLAELCAEWEDVPEPKVGYIIDPMEEDCLSVDDSGYEESDVERAKELGIWFETKEEAQKVAKQLKAWKRLKDKGFEFCCDIEYESLCGNGFNIPLNAIMPPEAYTDAEVGKDLDLLFCTEEKND